MAKKPVVDAILSTKENDRDTQSILAKEIAKKVDVTGAILGAIESTSAGPKSILVEKLGHFLPMTDAVYGSDTKTVAKDFLAGKFPLVKTDGSNIASLTDKGKALASAILGVEYTDSESKKRSVLVEKLGKSLDDNTDTYKAKYDGSNEQIAKDFLVSKGLGSASASDVVDKLITEKATELGTAILGVTKKVDNVDKPVLETNLAANLDLRTAVKNALVSDSNCGKDTKIQANAENPIFQGAVREVMSQPVFEIPADDNAPLSWDWI